MELAQKRKKAVYEICKKLMYEHGARFRKKHGNYLVRYAPKNQVVIMDTWNGVINQGHTTEILQDGEFGPVGKVDYHTHIVDEEYGHYRFELEEGVDVYKTLLATI